MYDVFISHANEDKEEIACPLARALEDRGLSVWIDHQAISLGESIRKKIDQGLLESKYAVIILSTTFFEKPWAENELNALLQLDSKKKTKLLPILHKISTAEVLRFSPLLSDRLSISSNRGVAECANIIVSTIKPEKSSFGGPSGLIEPALVCVTPDMSLFEIADYLCSSKKRHLASLGIHIKKTLAISENDIEMAMLKTSMIVEQILIDVANMVNHCNGNGLLDLLECLKEHHILGGIVAKHCAYIGTFGKHAAEDHVFGSSENTTRTRREYDLCCQSLKIVLNWYINTYGLSPVRPAQLVIVGPGQFSCEDIYNVHAIEGEFFPPELISPPEIVQEWYDHNPETLMGVRDLTTGKIVGFLNALPVTEELFNKIVSGDYVDTHIPINDIRLYDMPDFYKLYLSSLCIDKDFLHTNAFKVVLEAFIDKLMDLAISKEIFITEIVADAITPKGEQLCCFAGMRPLRSSTHASTIYKGVLLPPSLRIRHRSGLRLMAFYKRVYEEFKELI